MAEANEQDFSKLDGAVGRGAEEEAAAEVEIQLLSSQVQVLLAECHAVRGLPGATKALQEVFKLLTLVLTSDASGKLDSENLKQALDVLQADLGDVEEARSKEEDLFSMSHAASHPGP